MVHATSALLGLLEAEQRAGSRDPDEDAERYPVGSIEERQDLDVISPSSPLGEAIMGARVGDTVSYDAPGGTLAVRVVDIGA